MTGGKKWRVERQREGCWAAYDPVYGYAVHPWTFDTHAEAMREADRRARTITITIPRRDRILKLSAAAGGWVSITGIDWLMTAKNPEQAALDILAHHYRKGRS